tara:strand:+ start:1542 stop:1763 length:222 start_codon:yes stop_codon:yes gene_type:complete
LIIFGLSLISLLQINKDQEELLKQKDVIEKEERDLSEIAGQFQKLAKSEAKNQQKYVNLALLWSFFNKLCQIF